MNTKRIGSVAVLLLLGCTTIQEPPGQIEIEPDSVEILIDDQQALTIVSRSIETAIWSSDTATVAASALNIIGRRAGTAWVYAGEEHEARDSVHVSVIGWATSADRLTYQAGVAFDQSGYSGYVRARNGTVRDVKAGFAGVCKPDLVLHGVTDSSTIWDEAAWLNSRVGGCKWTPVVHVVAPGDEVTLRGVAATSRDILGDSLAPGLFGARVRVIRAHWRRTGGMMASIVDTVVFHDAGTVVIQ